MKKRQPALFAATILALSLNAQINSPSPQGYIARAEAMLSDQNYLGTLNQLAQVDASLLDATQREKVDWLNAQALFATEGAKAKNALISFLTSHPYSLHRYEALMRVGDCEFETDYPHALQIYDQIPPQSLSPSKAQDLCYRKAYCCLETGNAQRAEKLFAEIAQTRQWGNAARFYLAYIAYSRGDYAEAENLFKKVDKAQVPGNMADYYLAQIHYMRGDYKKALSTAKSLLKRTGIPSEFTTEAQRIAGESLYNTGDTPGAVEYLKKYVAGTAEPQPSTLYILGLSHYNQGNYREAVDALRTVGEADNAMAQSANLFIGQALMRTGGKDAALMAFDKALRKDHDKGVQEAAYYNYAVAKFGGANMPFGSAVTTFEEFLQRYPNSRYAPEVQQYIVEGYMTERNYDAALASIRRMKNPSQKVLAAKQKILYNIGASTLASGNPKTAMTYLTEADALAAHNPELANEVKLLIGEAAYRNGDLASSRSVLRAFIAKAKKSNPNLPLAYYDLAYTEFADKHYPEAARAFGQVKDSQGTLPATVVADAYNRLADIAYYNGDFTEAAGLYDRAFQTSPSTGDYALFQKAVMKGYVRDHKGKIADLSTMPTQFPSSTLLADAMLEMTASYIQLGDNASAIETYRQLIEKYPNTAQGRQGSLQLALTLLNNGQRAQAAEAYQAVVRNYPTSEEAREASEQLKRMAADDDRLDEYVAFVNSVPDAPQIDVAEVEQLAFEAAEKEYLTAGKATKLQAYAQNHPTGAYLARTLSMLLEWATENNNPEKALATATQLVERFPDNSLSEDAYAVVAQGLYEKGDAQAAFDTWSKLETRASSSKNLNASRFGIMRSARDLGNYPSVEQAADALLTSSTLGSEHKNEAIFSKALAQSQTGHAAQARETWATIAGMTDDLYGAKSALFMAQSLFDDGLTDKAQTAVEALTASGTPHSYELARGFILLSDIFAKKGDIFEAKEYLNALKDNYPGSESEIFMMIETRLNSLK